jgi:rhodanese-related sulfurtransferase
MINIKDLNFNKLTNVIVVLAIIVATGAVVKKYFFDSNESFQKIEVGKSISIPDVDWEQNGQTIILAVKQDCSFCTSSAPFLKDIVDKANDRNIKVDVVSSDSEDDIKNYLSQLGISGLKSHQIGLRKHGFVAAPTILFVGKVGIIKDIWVGGIKDENFPHVVKKFELFVADKIAQNQILDVVNNEFSINSNNLNEKLKNNNSLLIIDIDQREIYKDLHIKNAKNIPIDEIISRRREIPPDSEIIVYGRCPRDSGGKMAQEQLVKLGYSRASYISGGLIGWKNAGFSTEGNTE